MNAVAQFMALAYHIRCQSVIVQNSFLEVLGNIPEQPLSVQFMRLDSLI